MQNNWLKERLTQFKQDSKLWAAFVDTIQDVWNESVEPILTRISNRKSFFTMAREDMDTRIAEYGRFFVITETDKTRRPMLLAQRLDEVHFKGTVRPIEQTFWREFGTIPVSWEPLYAPVDTEKHPYGSFFATANEIPT
ncbi:TPA: phage tail protein, partial [Escherichia coli]|nr:phage tail protein [Escherichia coli]